MQAHAHLGTRRDEVLHAGDRIPVTDRADALGDRTVSAAASAATNRPPTGTNGGALLVRRRSSCTWCARVRCVRCVPVGNAIVRTRVLQVRVRVALGPWAPMCAIVGM